MIVNFAREGNVFIWVKGETDPTDEEWDAYLRFLESEAPKTDPPRAIIYSDGGSPTAGQRTRVNAIVGRLRKQGTKAAVLSNSVLVRGAMTAMNWFIPIYRAFKPSEVNGALEFLDVPREEWLTVRQRINELRVRIGTKPLPDVR